MSLIAEIFSGGTKGMLDGVGDLAKDIRSVVTGEIDPDKKAEIELKITELEGAARLAQVKLNQEEARHKSIFVAGWRPGVGWVCVLSLSYQFILHPLLLWANVVFKWGIINPPVLDTSGLFGLVTAMLGMGGLRTFDKTRGNG